MRILVNTRLLLPGKMEGVGRFTWEILQRLVSEHPTDEFIFAFDRPFDQQYIDFPNVKGIVVSPPARHPVLWWMWFEFGFRLAGVRYKPDVVLSMDGFLSLGSKTPTVLGVHDLAFRHFPGMVPALAQRYYDFFVPRYMRQAARIITVSNFVRSDFEKQYGIPPGKVRVACNAPNESFIPLPETEIENIRQKYTQGAPYFVVVGAIHPRKNIPRLVQAFDAFKEETGLPHRLLLAGRFAWQSEESEKAVANARYASHIVSPGYLPDSELPRVTAGAAASVYVSLSEGFGVPVLEAFSCHVPVVTSNTTSLPEVAGDAALLVDPYSVQAITEALVRIATDDTLRNNLISKGQKQRDKFSWEYAATVVWHAIKEAASLSNKPFTV